MDRHDGMNRRSFLVTLAGTFLGSYSLPSLPESEELSAVFPNCLPPPPNSDRKLFTSPTRHKNADRTFWLSWIEDTVGGRKYMSWRPKTEDEVAEALRFYEDARGFHAKLISVDTPVTEPSTEERLLIQAILDNLDADPPRLEYADWLTKHGNPAGEFIRLSIQLRRLGPDHPARLAVFTRRWSLLEKYAEQCYAPLDCLELRGKWWDLRGFDEIFSRGLLESLEINKPGILPERAAHLFAAAPFLHELELSYDGVEAAGIAEVPQLSQVTSLNLAGDCYSLDDFRVLLSSRYLSRLQELKLYHHFDPNGSDAGSLLAGLPILRRLRKLDVSYCGLGAEGVTTLLNGLRSAALVSLHIASNGVTPEVIRTLATADLQRIEELCLMSNEALGIDGMRALTTAPFLSRLRLLDLDKTGLDTNAAVALSEMPLVSLTALTLSSNDLFDAGVAALARSPAFANLAVLNLSFVEVGNAGVQAIAASPRLNRLTKLELGNNAISEPGIQALANSPNMTKLRELDIGWTQCGVNGALALSRSPHLKRLTSLRLTDTKIPTAGAEALAQSPSLASLTTLSLDENEIGARGALALAQSPYLGKLTFLSVSAAAVGETGKRALLDRFGPGVAKFR